MARERREGEAESKALSSSYCTVLQLHNLHTHAYIHIHIHIHTSKTQSQTALPRRHPNPHLPLTPQPRLINSALRKTDRRHHPAATTALHALPGILANVVQAFGVWAVQASVQFALLELRAHPGERVEEVVCACWGRGLRGQGGDGFAWARGFAGCVRAYVLGCC